MTTATKTILTEALKLKPKDREYLAHALLNSIPGDDDDFELTDDQKSLLERRIKECEANPGGGISWPELKKKLVPSRVRQKRSG